MKVLCLHGRGSNNEIFRVQMAPLQSALDDFEFDFVEGTDPHTDKEGNWSIYTSSFSEKPLYGYFNALYPSSVLQAEEDLLELIAESGPYDGVIAYSMGAMLAAQSIMRAARESPWGSPEDLPFRFAVFINGATPIHAFPFSDVAKTARKVGVSTLTDEITAALLRRSNMKGVEQIMATDRPAYLEAGEMALETMQARDGRLFLTDRVNCVWRYDASYDGTSLTIPTLHIRDPKDDKDQGLELLKLCDMSRVKEYHHVHGHDFPRGYAEMAKIASLIRSTAELV